MSKKLEKVINNIISDYQIKGGSKPVRFSIGLHMLDNKRTEYVSKRLGISKQELITKLFLAALEDLELKLELLQEDGRLVDWYKELLLSDEPIEKFIDED